MAAIINFNNPNILRGYLEQALPQEGLKESERRITVGLKGGLAYRLFEDTYNRFPLRFEIQSASNMTAVKDYFDAVQLYVRNALEHVREYGFGLVKVHDNLITDNIGSDEFIYEAGIGSECIRSAKAFQSFLDMIKSGKGQLDKEYQALLEKASAFYS